MSSSTIRSTIGSRMSLINRVSTRRFATYKSPFGPKYQTQPNYKGLTLTDAKVYGTVLGSLGAAAGTFALFFFADVPRVKVDIMYKVPGLRPFFEKIVAAEDNPF